MRQQNATTRIDPLKWERQVAANAARLRLPSGPDDWSLRLIHLMAQGPETVWDFTREKGCNFVSVTRFLEPLREQWERSDHPIELTGIVSKEISQSELPQNEPIIQEIAKGIIWGCRQGLENRLDADHYFLWFKNNVGFSRIAAITNPFSQPYTESWQRLINRAIGSGLLPPRRFVATYVTST